MAKIRTESLDKIKQEINPDEEIRDLRQRVKILNKRISDLKTEYGNLKTFFHDVSDAVEKAEADPILYYAAEKDKEVASPIIAVKQTSDSHMGAVQRADEIEGFNEFSPELCVERSMGFSKAFLRWVELHRSIYRIDEMAYLVTGDLISGDIHDNLRITNAFPTPEQTLRAGYLLADQIKLVAPHFSKVVVHFITEDNHGRLTKIPQKKEAGINSLNYLVGHIAKERVSLLENVEFNIYPTHQIVVHIATRRYLISHGHGVRGWAGVPWYGFDRKSGKEAIKRMVTDSNKFDKMIMGHFHTPITTPYYWLSGSVSGTDAHDHFEQRFAKPSQPAWMVHPKYGEFNRTDFTLA